MVLTLMIPPWLEQKFTAIKLNIAIKLDFCVTITKKKIATTVNFSYGEIALCLHMCIYIEICVLIYT